MNYKKKQINQPIIPYRQNISSHHLPVLDPMDKEGFDKIIAVHEMDSHIHILASTRSGKSELIKLIFIKQVQKEDGSIVVFDPNGDLSRQCAKLMNHKKDIIFIDPTIKQGFTITINPFRLKKIDEETISIVAQEIINALENIIGKEFSPNMEALLTPLIYTLLRKGDSGIDELLRFLDDDKNDDLIEYALKSPIKAHVDFIKSQFSKAKFSTTKDALSTKIQLLLNNPVFTNFTTGESTIDLEKALNNKKTIIIRLPKGKMRKTLEPAAKLIMASIQGIVFKRADLPEELRPKTYLICDEYQNLFSGMSDEMLSESAKNKLFILGAHQYSSQLTTKSKEGLMSAASIKVVGRNSNKDLKMMAEEIEVDLPQLKSLKQGQFFIKVGANNAIKIATSDKYLGDKIGISDEKWKKHLKYQIKHYYKKVSINEETSVVPTNDISTTNNSKDGASLPIPKFDIE